MARVPANRCPGAPPAERSPAHEIEASAGCNPDDARASECDAPHFLPVPSRYTWAQTWRIRRCSSSCCCWSRSYRALSGSASADPLRFAATARSGRFTGARAKSRPIPARRRVRAANSFAPGTKIEGDAPVDSRAFLQSDDFCTRPPADPGAADLKLLHLENRVLAAVPTSGPIVESPMFLQIMLYAIILFRFAASAVASAQAESRDHEIRPAPAAETTTT
jgi:hypothetical protein